MARTPDPTRREQLLDAVVDYLAEHGLSTLSMRPLAAHLGQSTRVLTHHFRDKRELLDATLRRLDEMNQQWLRALPGWQGDGPLSDVIRGAWEWQLNERNRPIARLIHEIEGLAAGGRLGDQLPGLFVDRLAFVAEAIEARGVPTDQAREISTFLNAAYTGLQLDYLTSGDAERTGAALERLAELTDQWVRAASGRTTGAPDPGPPTTDPVATAPPAIGASATDPSENATVRADG